MTHIVYLCNNNYFRFLGISILKISIRNRIDIEFEISIFSIKLKFGYSTPNFFTLTIFSLTLAVRRNHLYKFQIKIYIK